MNLQFNQEFVNRLSTLTEFVSTQAASTPSAESMKKIQKILGKMRAEMDNPTPDLHKINKNIVKLEKNAHSADIADFIGKVGQFKNSFSEVMQATALDLLSKDPAVMSQKEKELLVKIIGLIDQKAPLKDRCPLILHCAQSPHSIFRSLVPLCLRHGADPNAVDSAGITPLMHMAFYDQYDVAGALIDAGALIEANSKKSVNALGLAVEKQSCATILLLIKKGVSVESYVNGVPLWFSILKMGIKYELKTQSQQDLHSYVLRYCCPIIDLNTQDSFGKTLMHYAGEYDDIGLIKTLFLNGCKADDGVNVAIQQAAMQLCTRWNGDLLKDPEKVELLKILSSRGLLSPIFLDGTSMILEVMLKGPPDLKAFFQGVFDLTPKKIMELENVSQSLKQLNGNWNVIQAKELFALVKPMVEQLKESFPGSFSLLDSDLTLLEKQLDLRLEKVNGWFEQIARAGKEVSTSKRGARAPKNRSISSESHSQQFLQNDLVALCIQKKEHEMIPDIIKFFLPKLSRSEMIDKPAFHMFLDKCIPMISEKESLWTGGQSDVHAFLLLNLFRSVLDDKRVIPTLTEEDKALVKAILDQVFQSFALFIEKYKQNRQLAVREYCAFSQDPSIQFPILIPSGCASHATLLSIEKNPDGKTAKLTLFNTGKGIIEHHPHFEGDVRHFQTWLAYDNIPLTEFTETFFMGVLNAKDRESIDELYVCFHEIGKKGIPVPPSDSKQDYEQKQMQGTCSAQCLMAFLRYFIFAQAPGTLWHKLGFYKMLKATTFSLAAPRLKNVDQRIQPFVDKKLKKQEYELKIAEIARDEKRVSICQQAVFGALEKIGEGEFIAKIRSVPPNTQWERFGLLRAAVRHLSHKLTGSDLYQEFFNDNKDLEDILMIIDSLIAEKNAAEMHILSMLNMLKAKGDQAKLLEVLAKFIHSPHHADVIVSWVEKAVAEDPGFLTRFPDGYKRMIFFWFLKEDLAKKGNIELANLVE